MSGKARARLPACTKRVELRACCRTASGKFSSPCGWPLSWREDVEGEVERRRRHGVSAIAARRVSISAASVVRQPRAAQADFVLARVEEGGTKGSSVAAMPAVSECRG